MVCRSGFASDEMNQSSCSGLTGAVISRPESAMPWTIPICRIPHGKRAFSSLKEDARHYLSQNRTLSPDGRADSSAQTYSRILVPNDLAADPADLQRKSLSSLHQTAVTSSALDPEPYDIIARGQDGPSALGSRQPHPKHAQPHITILRFKTSLKTNTSSRMSR